MSNDNNAEINIVIDPEAFMAASHEERSHMLARAWAHTVSITAPEPRSIDPALQAHINALQQQASDEFEPLGLRAVSLIAAATSKGLEIATERLVDASIALIETEQLLARLRKMVPILPPDLRAKLDERDRADHALATREGWRHEVTSGETDLGYRAWVEQQTVTALDNLKRMKAEHAEEDAAEEAAAAADDDAPCPGCPACSPVTMH